MQINIDVTLLMSLISTANRSSQECCEAQEVTSCDDCKIGDRCHIKKSIVEGEKIIEKFVSR